MKRYRSNFVQSRTEARRRAGRAAVGCAVESLEGRQLFSVLTVNTTADTNASDGQLSLREAIALIQSGGDDNAALSRSLDGGEAAQVDTSTPFGTNDTIVFDNSIAGGTIVIGSQINVSGTMVIDGGTAGMTLSGGVSQATWRAFNVSSTGDLTLNKLTITNFSSRGSDGFFSPGDNGMGGAIYVSQGTLTITNSTLSNNAAVGGNGDLDVGGDGLGGAIYVDQGSTVTITGSTLANNATAGGLGFGFGDGGAYGGAIYAVDADVTINFSTLSGNTAAGGGRGLYVSNSGAATTEIDNSILGQADGSVTDLDFNGPFSMSGSNNLIRNINGVLASADPRLAALGDYGGGVQTFALLPDSPALDAAGAAGGVTTDARGTGRDYNGTSDIGAFESQGYTLTLDSSSTPQSAGVGQAFGNPLGVTLTEDGFGAAIPGATIFFTAPVSGASATVSTTATTDSGGDATVTPTANNVGGSYTIIASFSASVGGPQDVDFALTNTAAPTISSANSVTFTVGSAGTFTVTTTGTPLATLSNSGTLPGGITFVDNGDGTGTLSGTPAGFTGGDYTLTFTASNGISPDATQTFTLTVDQAPAVSSVDHATFTVGSAGTFTISTTGFPVAALSNSGALPSGVTFTDNGDGTATLAGTPASLTAGDYTLTFTASNGTSPDATQAFTLTVDEAPSISSSNHVTFTVGSAGTFTVTTGGSPVATLANTGSLPTGVTFTDNGDGTATLAGTPGTLAGGTYTLTFTASNGVSPDATQTFTLTVDEAPAITSSNSVTITAGSAGTFTVTTSGFPAGTLSETGSLPSGVTFTDNGDGTGTFAGTAVAGTGGVYTLTLDADNGVGSIDSQTFTLTVDEAPSITSANNTTFTSGSAGTFTITTGGYPVAALTKTGSLPTGVTFVDNGDGTATLSGTPTGSVGDFTLTITASNGISPDATQTFTLTVDKDPTITSANSTTFTAGTAGTFTITTGGYPVATLGNSGTLPSGVVFTDNGDGTATLSGTPSGISGGTYTLTFTASNGVSSDATQSFTLTVEQAPSITSANSAAMIAGTAGSFTITAAEFPAGTLTKTGSLPSGVNFVDNGDGTATLAGTPALGSGGVYTLTISADNGVGSIASQTFTLFVGQLPSITSADHVTFTVGVAGTFTVAAAGFPAPMLGKTGNLPAGVTFHDNGDGTATLSGTPTGAAASYTLGITADNEGLVVASQSFTLTVDPAPTSGVTGTAPTITSPATVNLVTGQATTFTVTTTGSPIATLQVTGTLPAGITFVDNGDGTGTFSGTATAAGDYAVSVVADNGVGTGATQALTLTVIPSHPVIVATGHAGGIVQVNNPDGSTRYTIKNPFKKGVGSRLASADVNGDGVADIIMAAGAGGQPQVLVYDGATGAKLAGFLAFAKSFTGGLFVAAADVDHDGTPDLVVGQGLGGTSKVRVFSGKDQSLLAEFNPIGAKNAAGVRVAAADLNGDGYAEVVAAQGSGDGRAVVKVFDGRALTKGNAKNLATLSRAELGFAGGAYVATGDVNGDGTPDVVVSQSAGSRPAVATFNGKKVAAGKNLGGALISKFNTASDNGARIASYDFDQDGFDDIITSATTGTTAIVKIFSGADGSVLDTIESDRAGQVFVA